MRKFLASAWFPFLAAVILAAGTAGAFAILAPSGADVGNSQIVKVFGIAGWAAGPVAGLVTLVLAFVLNGIRRVVRLRKVTLLHPAVAFVAVAPWLVFSYSIAMEPRFTAFARAAIDFVAEPLFAGCVLATAFIALMTVPALLITFRKPRTV